MPAKSVLRLNRMATLLGLGAATFTLIVSAPALAQSGDVPAETAAPECSEIKRADDVPANGSSVTVETPLIKIGSILPGARVYCSETMKGETIIRRYHERLSHDGQEFRLDHYRDGVGLGWGPKEAADFPVYDSFTKLYSYSSLDCRGTKYGVHSPVAVDCVSYLATADGDVLPVSLETRFSEISPDMKALINPRAFYDSGEYVTPDRQKPVTLTIGDTTKTLYFVGGTEGMAMGFFGKGGGELKERYARILIAALAGNDPVTLSYTDYEGQQVSYSFTEPDRLHARATLHYLQLLVKPVHQWTEHKASLAAQKSD